MASLAKTDLLPEGPLWVVIVESVLRPSAMTSNTHERAYILSQYPSPAELSQRWWEGAEVEIEDEHAGSHWVVFRLREGVRTGDCCVVYRVQGVDNLDTV